MAPGRPAPGHDTTREETQTENGGALLHSSGSLRSHRSWGWVLLAFTIAGCATVPVTGRKSFNLIPDNQANAMGADAYRQVLSESKVVTSGPEYRMMMDVGRRIAAVADQPDYQWEFSLIDDPNTVNAFCLPGGKVAVYTGIMPVAQNEDGLAVVMGHEIAHAVARHGSERMTDQLALQVAGAGLESLLGGASEGSRSLVLAAYGVGAQVGVLLPFGRSQESEADHIGLIYMARAGFDPHEAPRFWERMTAQGGGRPPEFLSTHPSPENRVKQLQDWMPEAEREARAAGH
ncbi:MAG: M48 family metallopeptidase [Candidatus Eisenbacteria bacterium]|uniref:M48 family metallopeptidase n=1 Tax=Eiseniibacteriota bacterium TaxID=2212470 RepID=A0A956RQK0_UNCEI|nr:M48 family metallopeptidase [Candidatus Eisenbacteria bacterium]